MDKRGVSEVFKHILVAIAGAVILIFFINLAWQQISLKEELDSAVLSRALNSNFDSFSISSNADKTIDLGGETAVYFNRFGNKFSCGKVGVDNVQPVSNENIIFAQSKIKGDKLDVWTARWTMPFSVVNFFYVSGNGINIIGSDEFARKLRGESNNVEAIPKRFFDIGNPKTVYLEDRNVNDNEIAVYGLKECSELEDNYKCRGNVKFSDGSGVFLGKEMMYAAIFSDSFADYECGINRAFDRLTKLSDIYIQKANSINCEEMSGLSRGLSKLRNLDLKTLNPDNIISDVNNLIELNKQARSNCGSYLF